jgi:hypothetical protein
VKEPITLADLSKTEISVGEFIDFFSNILTKIAKGKWYILGSAIIGSLLGGSLIF